MSFPIGNAGENKIQGLLDDAEIDFQKNTSKSRKVLSKWDFKFKFKNKSILVEVKYDIKSCLTGNVAIEVYNHKSQHLSGLLATEANIWFLITDKIYVTTTKQLLNFVHKTTPYRIVEGGDDNSTMLLYKKIEILKIFRECTNGRTFKKWLENMV